MLSVIIGIITIFMLCFILIKQFNYPVYLTPITSIAIIGVYMFITSIFGIYYLATLCFQVIVLALFLYQLIIKKQTNKLALKKMCTTSMIVFTFTTVCFLIFYCYVNACFTYWDEFSFWGTSAKIIFLDKNLYTLFENPLIVKTYFPGLPLFCNYFLMYETQFSEWICYFAYSVIYTSVFSIVFKNLKLKNYIIILIGLFLMFIITSATKFSFITIYSDMILGLLFAAAVLIYFSKFDDNKFKNISLVLTLMFLTTLKDMGFVLSGLVIFIILFDKLIYDKKKIGNTLKSIIIITFFVILVYIIWQINIKVLNLVPFNKMDLSHFEGIYNFIFLHDNNFEKIVFERFLYRLLYDKVFYINIFIYPIILLIISLICFIRKNKTENTKRIGSLMLLLFVSNILYFIILYVLYLISFLETEAYVLASFNRYITTIVYGTVIILIGLVIIYLYKNKSLKTTLIIIFVMLNCLFYYQTGFREYKYMLKYNFHPGYNITNQMYDQYYNLIKKRSKILFISQNEITSAFYLSLYYFLPNQIEGLPLYYYVPKIQKSKIEYSKFSTLAAHENMKASWMSVEMDSKKFKKKIIDGKYDYVMIYRIDGYLKYIMEPFLDGNVLKPNSMYTVSIEKNNLKLVSTPVFIQKI